MSDRAPLSAPASVTIRPYAIPGLATCLQDRRICLDGTPLPVSSFDVEALSLAEWAVARRRTLVLCPADPLTPLAELIAAAVHVADMTTRYAATGLSAASSRRVAVVTSDFHARGLYRSLGVRHPSGGRAEPLRDAVPAATLGRDGVIRVLGRSSALGWSTVFVGSVGELRLLGKIDLAVVDLAAPGAETVVDLRTPAVLIARDPADSRLLQMSAKALVLGWGRDDLDRIRDDETLPPRLAARALGAGSEIAAVVSDKVCENAAMFWQDIGALIQASRASSLSGELARLAFGLFHDLLGLALPMQLFEAAAEPVAVRLKAIATAARLAHGEARDLYLPMVELELRDLASAIGETPPKDAAMMRILGQLVDDNRDVMVIARTAELARLYGMRLARHQRLADVRITSLGALRDQSSADVAVLTGMAPTWARWVYRSGIARRLVILAYTSNEHVLSEAGFSEVDMVRRVVADQSARENWLARPSARDKVWSELSGEPRRLPDDPEAGPESPSAPRTYFLPAPIEVPPGLWDRTGWLAPLEAGPTASTPSPAGYASPATQAAVEAVKVVFEDGRWALLDRGGTVTRFRPGSATGQAGYRVSELAVGDQVLFFDRDSRKDVLAKVIEVASEVPELAVAGAWLNHWRRVLAGAYRAFGSYARFRAALVSEGCSVQTQTVRLWVTGDTIGPDDDDDVRRVGLVTKDDALLAAHREVCRAIHSLRGAHMRLGKRVSDMARRVGPAVAAGQIGADEVVDELSGLTAADFEDSIDILTVASIEPAGVVPSIVTGRLDDPDTSDSDE